MITLYQFRRQWGINSSPFCLKVELLLCIFGLEYRVVDRNADVKPPKGKVPYIKDEEVIIADSEFIVEHLRQKYGKDMDAGLAPHKRAIGYAFAKMLEEHLFWVALYSRWFEPQNEEEMLRSSWAHLPPEYIAKVKEKVHRDFVGSGMGLHKGEELYFLGLKDLTALSDFVEAKEGEFIFGGAPRMIDIILCAFLAQVAEPPISSPLKTALLQNKILMQYYQMLKKLWIERFGL